MRKRSERGAALLEFVLVIPIFLFVLYGLIAFGMAISLKQSITHAASQGARSAIGAPVTSACTAPTNGDTPQQCAWKLAASNQVQSALHWMGSNEAYVTVTPSVAACAGDSSNQCITVVLDYDYQNHPLIPSAPGLGIINPTRLTSTAIVQVQ
jgi:Flp pilus assembly protein TadG